MLRSFFPRPFANFPQFLGLWLGTFALIGCNSTPVVIENSPIPSPIIEPTYTSSPTIVWFPATNTPTVIPTTVPIPTEDIRPGQGNIIFKDEFEAEGDWSLISGNVGSAAVVNGHLTLALTEPKSFLFTTRTSPVFDNFYLEITANLNLCRGADEYGLLIRVTQSLEYYRFSLSCDGRARVDRYYNGLVSSVVPWTANGIIPTGVPSSVRIGVWALKKEIRFFIDDLYLFSVSDPILFSGTVGAFIRTSADTPVTVTFSELVVKELVE